MNNIFRAMFMSNNVSAQYFPSNVDELSNNVSTQTETALMYDAVQIFARALSELDQSQVNTWLRTENIVLL